MAICSCNDGLRPVIFKLEATEQESEIDYTPRCGSTGRAPERQKCGKWLLRAFFAANLPYGIVTGQSIGLFFIR